MSAIASHEVFVGALVTWLHEPRGGYGFVCPTPAKVVALNLDGDRATIAVETSDGQIVKRRVKVERLRWRKDAPPAGHRTGATTAEPSVSDTEEK